MENSIIISLIVPVYNGEKFLQRAFDSILCQMDNPIEMILVDDGSTDSSGAICDEYASKHPNIHVIHKANGGTSSAKNMGIARAQGAYLAFMDCDDFLDADTFAQIIPVLQAVQPDCLDFGLKYVGTNGEIAENLHQCPKNELLPQTYLDTVILPPLLNLKKDDAHFIFDFCCNKVFKGSIIRQHGIRFDEEKRTWEDRTFLLRHLRHCQNYYCLDKSFYNYVYVPNSLSQRYSPDYFKIIVANFTHYRELFGKQFDFDTRYCNNYWANAIEKMVFTSLNQKQNGQLIRQNTLDALQNEQVIHWYKHRDVTEAYQRKAAGYVINGQPARALQCYIRHNKITKIKQSVSYAKSAAKAILSKALRIGR